MAATPSSKCLVLMCRPVSPSPPPIIVIKYPDKGNLRKRFVLVFNSRELPSIVVGRHGSRQGRHEDSGWRLAGHTASTLRKQRTDRKWIQAIKTHSPPLLPPVRLHLPKAPQPSQTPQPAEDQMFKHVNLSGILHIQTTTMGKLRPGRVWHWPTVTLIGERWGLGNMVQSVSTTLDS